MANSQPVALRKFTPTSPPAGTAAPVWRKSKRPSPISRELIARILIRNCHPALARVLFCALRWPNWGRGLKAVHGVGHCSSPRPPEPRHSPVSRWLLPGSWARSSSITARCAGQARRLPYSSKDQSLTTALATRRVAVSDVCSMPHEEVVGEVSTSLRQEVFQEYGIVNAHADDYEIDYLIAPGLGGVEDIHNLWPEPYRSRAWNARVKDTLEERLHELVCAGKLDLATAQHEIATDWIAAYKKYFHTDRPLSLRSHLISDESQGVGDAKSRGAQSIVNQLVPAKRIGMIAGSEPSPDLLPSLGAIE
jgi:hypothetical protein